MFNNRNFGILLAVIAVLLVGTLMPGNVKASIESRAWSGIPWSSLAHLVLFAVIALVPVYGPVPRGYYWALLLATTLAGGTEWLQQFVPGRYPRLRDVMIDLSGTAIGCAISANGYWQRWVNGARSTSVQQA